MLDRFCDQLAFHAAICRKQVNRPLSRALRRERIIDDKPPVRREIHLFWIDPVQRLQNLWPPSRCRLQDNLTDVVFPKEQRKNLTGIRRPGSRLHKPCLLVVEENRPSAAVERHYAQIVKPGLVEPRISDTLRIR